MKSSEKSEAETKTLKFYRTKIIFISNYDRKHCKL